MDPCGLCRGPPATECDGGRRCGSLGRGPGPGHHAAVSIGRPGRALRLPAGCVTPRRDEHGQVPRTSCPPGSVKLAHNVIRAVSAERQREREHHIHSNIIACLTSAAILRHSPGTSLCPVCRFRDRVFRLQCFCAHLLETSRCRGASSIDTHSLKSDVLAFSTPLLLHTASKSALDCTRLSCACCAATRLIFASIASPQPRLQLFLVLWTCSQLPYLDSGPEFHHVPV